ncbi:MAG: preprotein translocase subunit YajC [Planctomycetes bacterium]|nr:preprotein translocase subunit YajC [Planctomycetota bacterium]
MAKHESERNNAENAQKTLAIDLSITTVRALLLRAEMSYDPTQLILLAQSPQPQGSPMGMFVPMILMVVIFYFLLIRPQQKKAKEHTKMVGALKSGASVVTRGGVVGTVQSVKETTVSVRSLESKFEVEKHAIERVISNNSDSKTDNK